MGLIRHLVDIFLHLDRYLGQILSDYGSATYAILFAVVFCETGLVVTPFLPGDSLLFATGAFAAKGWLNVWAVAGLLSLAAFLGDTANYWIGRKLGPKVFTREDSWLLNKKYLLRTHAFYERHGGKTIIIARFVPIIRTFAPFVAGIGEMSYWRFISYNAVGGVAWVCICTFAGFFFGGMELVQKNFSLVILAIILISVLPIGIEFFRERGRLRREALNAQKAAGGDPTAA